MTIEANPSTSVGVAGIGFRGAPGPATTITVQSVTTLQPGSAATVVMGGSAPSQTVAFGIPRGARIFTGSAAPGTPGSMGAGNSDIYIRTTGLVYQVQASAWVELASFVGPQGDSAELRYISETEMVQARTGDGPWEDLFEVPSVATVTSLRDQVSALKAETTTIRGEAIDARDAAEDFAAAAAAAAASIDPADFVPPTRTITAGTGLTGGGNLSANRTLSVDVGTTANKIVRLDASGRLPAVSGALLTDLPAPSVPKATRLEATQGTDDTKFLTSLVVASACDFTYLGIGSGDYFWTPRSAAISENGPNHRVAANGARTIRNPANAPYRGQTGIFVIYSTTSTAHTISWDTQFEFPGSLPVLPSTANRAIVVRWTNLGMFGTPRLLCEVLHTNFDGSF